METVEWGKICKSVINQWRTNHEHNSKFEFIFLPNSEQQQKNHVLVRKLLSFITYYHQKKKPILNLILTNVLLCIYSILLKTKEKRNEMIMRKNPAGFCISQNDIKRKTFRKKTQKNEKYEWQKRSWKQSWTEERARRAAKQSDRYINHKLCDSWSENMAIDTYASMHHCRRWTINWNEMRNKNSWIEFERNSHACITAADHIQDRWDIYLNRVGCVCVRLLLKPLSSRTNYVHVYTETHIWHPSEYLSISHKLN